MACTSLMLAPRRPIQTQLLCTAFVFAILTWWVRDYWPTAVFQVFIFALTATAAWSLRTVPTHFSWPAIPLVSTLIWGSAQWALGLTEYAFVTRVAILKWTTFL